MSPVILALFIVTAVFDLSTALHALMTKRDPPSSVGWTIACLSLPVVGGFLYLLLGVNRIKTKAQKLKNKGRFDSGAKRDYHDVEGELAKVYPDRADTVAALLQISSRVTNRPLLRGNKVEPLYCGDEAYPLMLEAIGNAEKSVYLVTYLFDTDAMGLRFVDALSATAARGVDVRIVVDAIGELNSPSTRVSKLLSVREGVKVARYMPPALSLRGLSLNLRNHRKILVVDSEVGFTGGMNIGGMNVCADPDNDHPIEDLHFRVTGPIVYALEDVFFEDWYFSTGQKPDWKTDRCPLEPKGDAMCRGISDGPNEDYEVLTWILVGALSTARKRVQIRTPYFLPSRELLSALNAAALRGVQVDVILPAKNNLPPIAWAAQDRLVDVLEHGVRVYFRRAPFTHAKLLIMDEFYVILGSANLDPRSLRLNFEFNLEVYDANLATELSRRFDADRENADEMTREMLAKRGFFTKLRDSIAKLFSPYL